MTKQDQNLEICKNLVEFFSRPENRDIRFFQGLYAMGLFNQQFDDRLNCTGVEDPFYVNNEKVLIKTNKK